MGSPVKIIFLRNATKKNNASRVWLRYERPTLNDGWVNENNINIPIFVIFLPLISHKYDTTRPDATCCWIYNYYFLHGTTLSDRKEKQESRFFFVHIYLSIENILFIFDHPPTILLLRYGWWYFISYYCTFSSFLSNSTPSISFFPVRDLF